MIRRELPLTINARPVEPVADVRRGFSFVLAPAAADPVLELDSMVQSFFFFPIWKAFAFVFSCSNGLRQVASALIAMAQIKPNNSRPIAVVIFL